MGRSTVQDLIARGQNRNDYNNTGIDSNAKWVDAFNSALQDLVNDIALTDQFFINFVQGTREYDLPSDFYELRELWDAFNLPSFKRRFYDQNQFGFFPADVQGYFILFRGVNYTIDLYPYNTTQTFRGIYVRYPRLLSVGELTAQPEVPTIGEDALIDYAIMTALRNNNLIGEANKIEVKYERNRKKIQDAVARAGVGW